MDDPGLFAAFLPFYRILPRCVRWSICTEDVFFAVPFIQPFMGAGNVLPLDRSGSLFQPAFKMFWEKLNEGGWCHIFPEGRIWQDWRFEPEEPHLGPFKIGVGKMIAHCEEGQEPIIIPMYHRGMDYVIPEKVLKKGSRKASKPRVKFPKIGQKIDVYFGEPFDTKETVDKFKREHPGLLDSWDHNSKEALELYQTLANEVRDKVLEVEAVAHNRKGA
jgi:monolysocardiolipin acyltransferase